jgi:folate-binding protein YgfZ
MFAWHRQFWRTGACCACPAGRAGFGALLTPQGKIIVDFFIIEDGGDFLIDCLRALAADLLKRLRMYKLRAKVEIADLSDAWGVAAIWETGEAPPPGAVPDPRDPSMGSRLAAPRPGLPPASASPDAYDARRIAFGLPKGGLDFAYGDAFPHEANMDRLHGVDFRKGCYVGQEVVSRVEHRGTARKRIAKVRFDGEAPPPGAPIRAGDIEIGTTGSAADSHGLAMVRTDRAREAMAAGIAFVADGRTLSIELP